ncbi:MAG: hypothetical protein K5648_07005 [Erysipelotrichaceae bacterium]|nr:hypothetical protein [Erysipelotrichaceae bacterium]
MKNKGVVVLCILMMLSCLSACSSTAVPDFTGHNVLEVYQWCSTIDTKYACEVSYADGNGAEKDTVIEQSVKGGSRLNSDISFKISNGAVAEIPVLYINEETQKSDVELWRQNSGIQSLTYIEEPSDTVEKNHVIRIQPTSGIRKDTPVTVYISSGRKQDETPVNTEIQIVFGDFIGLTVEQFETKARQLGLNPNHNTTRDRFNKDVAFGNIAWHGSGTYVKGETFNYGICINAIEVVGGTYIGLSESDFQAKARELTLSPKHIYGRDAYSTRIDEGYVVTHGYGTYEKGEEWKYGLSLGPARVVSGYEGSTEEALLNYLNGMGLKGSRTTAKSSTVPAGRIISYNTGKYSSGDSVSYVVSAGYDVNVNVPDFKGETEKSFLDFLRGSGLNVGIRTMQSSLVPAGNIVSNDTGIRTKGSKIDYVVSSGPVIPMGHLDSFADMKAMLSDYDVGYYAAKKNVEKYLKDRGFTDYEIWGEYSEKYYDGTLLYVVVGDHTLSGADDFPTYSHIIVSISADLYTNN